MLYFDRATGMDYKINTGDNGVKPELFTEFPKYCSIESPCTPDNIDPMYRADPAAP